MVGGEGEDSAFGATAYGAGYVGVGGEQGSSGEDEGSDFGGCFVEGVDVVFEFGDVLGGEAPGGWLLSFGYCGGEVSSEVEEHVLDCEEVSVLLVGAVGV